MNGFPQLVFKKFYDLQVLSKYVLESVVVYFCIFYFNSSLSKLLAFILRNVRLPFNGVVLWVCKRLNSCNLTINECAHVFLVSIYFDSPIYIRIFVHLTNDFHWILANHCKNLIQFTTIVLIHLHTFSMRTVCHSFYEYVVALCCVPFH